MIECESCNASACPEGACDQCIGSGRHERLGRGLPRPEDVRKPSRGDIWCRTYTEVFFAAPPMIPTLPANASREAVQQVGTFVLLKGLVAAMEATRVVLQAA
jgi:hypothetical protein